MSNRSGQYSEYPQHHPHDHGRPFTRRAPAQAANEAASMRSQSGYTIMHAGKQVRFGPVAFWIVVGTVTLLGMWSAATATYFAFRDDVLTRLIARQAEMQYAYEDRIAELRARVDRTASRQLLDQEQFDQKLEQIMRRQTALESRATALGAIPDVTGSIRSTAPARGAGPIADPERQTETRSATPSFSWRRRIAKRGSNRVNRFSPVRRRPGSPRIRASTARWCGCKRHSIRSRIARWRRSARMEDGIWNCASAGCAASSAISASTWRSSRPQRRAPPMGGPFVPVKLSADATSLSTASFIAST